MSASWQPAAWRSTSSWLSPSWRLTSWRLTSSRPCRLASRLLGCSSSSWRSSSWRSSFWRSSSWRFVFLALDDERLRVRPPAFAALPFTAAAASSALSTATSLILSTIVSTTPCAMSVPSTFLPTRFPAFAIFSGCLHVVFSSSNGVVLLPFAPRLYRPVSTCPRFRLSAERARSPHDPTLMLCPLPSSTGSAPVSTRSPIASGPSPSASGPGH